MLLSKLSPVMSILPYLAIYRRVSFKLHKKLIKMSLIASSHIQCHRGRYKMVHKYTFKVIISICLPNIISSILKLSLTNVHLNSRVLSTVYTGLWKQYAIHLSCHQVKHGTSSLPTRYQNFMSPCLSRWWYLAGIK